MGPQHVGQVVSVERGLAHSQDERSPFLEGDIGGPVDEVAGVTAGNGAQGACGAGQDDHGVVQARAAGNRAR